MGSYLFRWPHAANEVYVTGSFDDWSKSVKLNRGDGYFEKQVDLPSSDEKIIYKYVVDGNWVTDTDAPTENDAFGNANNVLTPEDIAKGGPQSSETTSSGQGQPADQADSGMPGAFPEPTPLDEGSYTPIQLWPGDMVPDYSTYYSTTRPAKSSHNDTSAARNPDEQAFGVNPIPASGGHGNPIKLEPGQPVPPSSEVTSNDLQSNVHTDKESYEKSGSASFASLGGAAAASAFGSAGAFGLPEKSNNMIPESSLPMGEGAAATSQDEGPMMRSAAGTETSTAALAGQVPLETRGVPEVVEKSQAEAGAESEALQSTDAMQEKEELENELRSKVPEEPPTSTDETIRSAAGTDTSTGALAGQVPLEPRGVPQVVEKSQAEVGADPEASQSSEAVQEKRELEDELRQKVPEEPATSTDETTALDPSSVASDSAAPQTTSGLPVGDDVAPQMVQESQREVGAPAEASASPEAVAEKREVEEELKQKVPEEQSSSENKTGIYAAVGGAAAAAAGGIAYASQKAGVPQSIQDKISSMNTGSAKPANDVPQPVTDSYERSAQDPEAAANPEAVHEKSDMERELLQDVKRTDEAGEPAPALSAEHATQAPGTGSGVEAPAAGVVGGAYSYHSDPDNTVSDTTPFIADADTMPAIAMANRDMPTESGMGSTTGGALGAPEDVTASSTRPSAAEIAARAMGAPLTTGSAPTTSAIPATMPSEPTTMASEPMTTSATRGVFDDDPTSAVGSSAPAITSTRDTLDPRTTASAFANDPISANEDSSVGTLAGSTGPSTSGLNAPASAPAQSVATETLASKENAPPVDTATTSTGATSKPFSGSAAPATAVATGGAASGGAMAAALGASKQRQDSRDISPFTRGADSPGPSTTTGVSTGKTATSQGPSTPQKGGKTPVTGTPASAKSTGTTGTTGTTTSSTREKRRSRLGQWFSEHLGSERKSKK